MSFLLELDHRRTVPRRQLDVRVFPDRRGLVIDVLPNSMIGLEMIGA
jgi:hypothetical protein